MRRLMFSAVLLLALCSQAFGQLEVKSKVSQALSGAKSPVVIGDLIFVAEDSEVSVQTVGLIKVISEAANVTIEAEDAARNPVELKRFGDYYVISNTGKYWVEVTAVDFAKQIYATEKITLEIGDSVDPQPGPSPDPKPGPEPDPKPITDFKGWVVIVEETADSTPALRNLKLSGEWADLERQGIKRRFYDKDQTSAASYVEIVNQNGLSLPIMFLVRESASGAFVVEKTLPIPSNMAELKKVIGK